MFKFFTKKLSTNNLDELKGLNSVIEKSKYYKIFYTNYCAELLLHYYDKKEKIYKILYKKYYMDLYE